MGGVGGAWTSLALEFLKTVKDKKLRRQVVNRINELAKEPFPKGRCEPVKGAQEGGDQVYRIKQGRHRILYVVRSPTIVILDIDHRKQVYRGL